METIWDFTYMVLLALGMFLTGVYAKRALAVYKRLNRKRKRYSLAARVEQLEKRVELHTRKDKVYLDKFDEIEATMKRRETRRKSYVKQAVLDYLKELQK